MNLTNEEIDKKIEELLAQKTFPDALTADGAPIKIGGTYYFHNESENRIDTRVVPSTAKFFIVSYIEEIEYMGENVYFDSLFFSKEEAIKNTLKYLESRITKTEKILSERTKILEDFKANNEIPNKQSDRFDKFDSSDF